MRQERNSLFQQRAFAITRYCTGTVKELIEHGGTSGGMGKRNILPSAYRQNYAAQKMGETLITAEETSLAT
jgi:hypothetical protein